MRFTAEGILFESAQDKAEFYTYVSTKTQLLSGEEYTLITDNSSETIAFLAYGVESDCLEYLDVYVNTDKFSQFSSDPELLQQLMSIVVRHEAAEQWYLFSPERIIAYEHREDPGQGPAHQRALVEEWLLAEELGLREMYLNCILTWSEEIEEIHGPEIATQFRTENLIQYQNQLLQEILKW